VFRALLDAVDVSILGFDADGRVIHVNLCARALMAVADRSGGCRAAGKLRNGRSPCAVLGRPRVPAWLNDDPR
jgi:hypothetical protein